MLSLFIKWCQLQGAKSETASTYATNVRTIVRHALPQMFPKCESRSIPPRHLIASVPAQAGIPEAAAACANDTLGVYADKYLLARAVGQGHVGTLRRRCRAFEKFIGHPIKLTDITPDLINEFLHALQTTDRTPITLSGYRADLLAVLNGAADRRIIDHINPRLIRKVKIPQTIPEAWSKEEVEQLLDTCARVPGHFKNGVIRALFWEAIIRVGYDSGARLGDVLDMRVGDYDETGLWVWIQNKSGKLKSCRFHPSTLTALEATFPPERDLVFDWPHPRETWFDHFRHLVKASGLSKGTFKWLRRTSGSLVEAQQPGAGHKHLRNGAAIFDWHYSVPSLANVNAPMPPELSPVVGKGGAA